MSQVRTRKRGKTFSYIFEAGKKADGKRKVIEKGGFPTKKDAYDAGVSAYNDWKQGNIGITSENILLKDYLQNWFETYLSPTIKINSVQIYQSMLKKHILPELGNISIQKLTPAILDKFILKLFTDGYSKNTISQIHGLLHHALDYAVYPAEIISSNPINYIKIPKKAPIKIIKRQIITPEKLNELLEKYPFGSPYYIPILILYHTGMRISEVLGLTWDNVDFARNVITLKKQIVYISKRGYYFSTLKTESSNRNIVIDNFLAGELRHWQNKQADNETSAGKSYIFVYKDVENKILQQSKGLEEIDAEKVLSVCTKQDGQLVSRNFVEKMLRKENLNAHSFRHTHATILIENGATPKGVAGRLGHADALITQNLYTHNTEKLQIDTAKIFVKTMQTNL